MDDMKKRFDYLIKFEVVAPTNPSEKKIKNRRLHFNNPHLNEH